MLSGGGAGVVIGNAALFDGANSERFTITNHADLQGSAVSGFWRALWYYKPAAQTAVSSTLFQCSNQSNTGWDITDTGAIGLDDRIWIRERATGKLAHVGAGANLDDWTFFYGHLDSSGNLYAAMYDTDGNLMAEATATAATFVAEGAAAAVIGGTNSAGTLTGRIDALCGGDGNLTAGEFALLLNGGAGVNAATADASVLAKTLFWFDMEEESGDRADSVGSHVATDVNTVGFDTGHTEAP